MSDNSTNPLDGLPAPEKGAKPSPLNSDPGSLPDTDRWWLKSSINPEEVPPETDTEGFSNESGLQDSSQSAVSTDDSPKPVNAPKDVPTDTEIDRTEKGGNQTLSYIVVGLLAVGIIAAVVIFGGK